MKISVIIAVYKAEKYIRKCLESLLLQTFQDFEVLLIDDGSPDKSGQICDEYALKDSRFRVFHKENGGVSTARQCGLINAVGEYIIHVDPDDWVESAMLEELYNTAKQEDSDMVICDFYCDYNGTNECIYVNQTPSNLNHITILKELFYHLHGSCCNKLVKRQCFIDYKISFPLEISFCEDLYVNASLLKNNIKIAYLPKAFYHYVQDINSNSLAYSYKKENAKRDIRVKELFLQLLKGTDAYVACEHRFTYVIISRAYNGNCFTSLEFRKFFYVYRKSILANQKISFREKYIYYLSCIGLYRLISTLIKTYQSIKKNIK